MTYKAVLFDMDGVIVGSEGLHLAAFREVLKRHGYKLTDAQYEEYFAGGTDEAGFNAYFEALGESFDLASYMKEKAVLYLELAAGHLVPYPGVTELIRELDEQGMPLALVTGSLRVEAEITLKTFGIAELFSVIVVAEDITESKPNPEGYLQAAERLGVSPVDCLVIEDSPSGVMAAKAAGMRCVAVLTTHTATQLSQADVQLARLESGCLDTL